jgi:hypothetical protein
MLQLVQSSAARPSVSAIHGVQWGRQSCLQPPFRRLANPEHWRSQRGSGVMSCRNRDGKPEKLVGRRASRLKAGCSQDWLPHEMPKTSTGRGPALELPTNGRSRRANYARLDKLKHIPQIQDHEMISAPPHECGRCRVLELYSLVWCLFRWRLTRDVNIRTLSKLIPDNNR